MRILLAMIALMAVAGCEPQIPDSGAGVGFGDYGTYRGDAASGSSGAVVQNVILPETGGGGAAAGADGGGGAAELSETAVPAGLARISDEQDFEAVSARETIESDAARIAANRELYEIIEPRDLPVRTGAPMSMVVEYALATNNPVGQPLYKRSRIFAENRFIRNCAKYASPDLAQEDFLKRGGPKRDPRGLDPDGDGFACYWSPLPYRQARLAAQVPAPAPAADPGVPVPGE